MATFNVTQHGVDNVFKWSTTPNALAASEAQPSSMLSVGEPPPDLSGDDEGVAVPAEVPSRGMSARSGCTLPPIPGRYPPLTTLVAGNTPDRPRPFPSVPLHHGSHQKFLEIRKKHRRDVRGKGDHIYTLSDLN